MGRVVSVPITDEPIVSIVTVAARNPERLLRCLRAVTHEVPSDLPYEVVVVLNAAEPEMRVRIDEDVEGVRLVESEIPLGLAGGANLGAARARGRLLHLLHDDTEVGHDWLTPLVRALDERPDVGAVGSATLSHDGSLQTAGWVLWRDGLTSPPWLDSPPPVDALGDAYPVDYCASASVLVRRAAWDACGGLDEGFHPAYYVDVDLAMSLRSCGYVVMCEPASRVKHEGGGSSELVYRQFVAARNRERFVEKWREDLAHQEPRADDAGALARARQSTERRAAAVAAALRATPTAGRVAAPENERGRLYRERAALQRDLAVKDAFIAHARELFIEATTARQRLEEEALNARCALEESRHAADEVQRRYAALEHEHDLLASRLTATAAEVESLRRKAETLAAIEAGGWWRLRGRILPVLRLARRVQRTLDRSHRSHGGR